jgi:hypothetical protein
MRRPLIWESRVDNTPTKIKLFYSVAETNWGGHGESDRGSQFRVFNDTLDLNGGLRDGKLDALKSCWSFAALDKR